jgi:hypothetical protein
VTRTACVLVQYSSEKRKRSTQSYLRPPFSIFSSAMLDRDWEGNRMDVLLLRAKVREHNCLSRNEMADWRVESMMSCD